MKTVSAKGKTGTSANFIVEMATLWRSGKATSRRIPVLFLKPPVFGNICFCWSIPRPVRGVVGVGGTTACDKNQPDQAGPVEGLGMGRLSVARCRWQPPRRLGFETLHRFQSLCFPPCSWDVIPFLAPCQTAIAAPSPTIPHTNNPKP